MAKGYDSATRIRRERVDDLDDPSTAPEEVLELTGIIILPRTSHEEGRGWVTLSGRDIYVLPSSRVREPGGTYRRFEEGDVVERDIIQVGARTFQVEGEPADYRKHGESAGVLIRVGRAGVSR